MIQLCYTRQYTLSFTYCAYNLVNLASVSFFLSSCTLNHSSFIILKQVIIEGIGIFSICLGGDFASSGFLHQSLYMLLENLISSNYHVRSSSDAVLHILAATSGYPTVSQCNIHHLNLFQICGFNCLVYNFFILIVL